MSTSTPLSFLHSLPDAADIDVSEIKGNESYGAQVGRRLRLVEMNIWGKGAAAQGQTLTMCVDMCNVYGTLHGACAAYIVDPGTKLRVLSNSVYVHGRIRTARCEAKKDKLYVSTVHSTVNNTRPKL
ncbi:hypothetical protein BDZ89DRAFT_1062110 [Hymenopellis radicata]|nr:hypothetical protein BDZ89DRAFT_1062110 [Hymenopellis radicata]